MKAILSRCMKCKILKARPGTQVMSGLPESNKHSVGKRKCASLDREARGEKARKLSRIASVDVPNHFTRCFGDEKFGKSHKSYKFGENLMSPKESLVSPKVDVISPTKDNEANTHDSFLFPGGYPFVKSHGVLPQIPDGGSSLRRSHDELRPVVEAVWRRWMREYVPMLQRRSK